MKKFLFAVAVLQSTLSPPFLYLCHQCIIYVPFVNDFINSFEVTDIVYNLRNRPEHLDTAPYRKLYIGWKALSRNSSFLQSESVLHISICS